MNPDLTHLLFILDRSGSMAAMADDAIHGFNSFLQDQLHEPGDARLTLVLFDDQYEVPCNNVPLVEALPLDHRSFVPRGTTALLDATARAIDELGTTLSSLPESDRPGTVIVAILTDGYENASHRFTWRDVSRRIRHQSKHYQWQFLFLGANQDAIATAAQIGIQSHNTATWVADQHGTAASMKSISRKSSAVRKTRGGHSLTKEEQADLSAPMENILREEDQKRRGDS